MTALARAISAATEGIQVWPRWLALSLAGVAFLLLCGLPTIIIPLATDQTLFALGARTVLDGQQLYGDFWEIKSPLIYLVYAIPFALAGEHMEAIRVLDLVNTGIAMLAIFLLTERYFNERAAVFAAALYAFSYLTWGAFDGLAEIESFMAAPLAFGLYLYRAETGTRAYRFAFLAGLALGVAVGLKSAAVLFVLAPLTVELLARGDTGWTSRAAVERLALAALGFVLVQVAWLSYLAGAGVLDDFIDIQRHYTAPYNADRYAPADMSHARFVLLTTGDFLREAAFITVPAAIGLFVALARPRETRGAYVLGLLVLLGFAAVWWQGKMFHYHWLLVLPLLAPLAGYGADRLAALLAGLPRPQAIAGAAVVAAGFVLVASHPLTETYDGYRYLLRRVDGSMTVRDLEAKYNPQFRENRAVVDYVEAHGAPEDKLFIWGLWPVSYFWLDRPLASRFSGNEGLRSTWAPEDWRRELVEELEASQPRFFAVARGDKQPWLVGTAQTSDEHLEDSYPALKAFLQENYIPVLDVGLFILYERAPAAVERDSISSR